ncbi:hypothetical protein, partial [Nonomuraea sp. NPDC023979]|uniref:hypothetical protein n=1 Tax=Nonomuraea sp. NPDC023979 TaxID=3154796 RepID=UPI00340B5258
MTMTPTAPPAPPAPPPVAPAAPAPQAAPAPVPEETRELQRAGAVVGRELDVETLVAVTSR